MLFCSLLRQSRISKQLFLHRPWPHSNGLGSVGISLVSCHQETSFQGVDQNFGHRTSFPRKRVCYLSAENVSYKFHPALYFSFAGAMLAQVNGFCLPSSHYNLSQSTVHLRQINDNARLTSKCLCWQNNVGNKATLASDCIKRDWCLSSDRILLHSG